MKKQHGKIQLFGHHVSVHAAFAVISRKNKGATCRKTLTNETLGVGDRGL